MTLSASQTAGQSLILCVEDEPNLRADIVEELCAAGHDAIAASNGHEALACVRSTRPDMVLCDITMPGMDGLELLAHMRAPDKDLADIPVVFLTARDTREDLLEGKRSGAEDYLFKPVDFELMLASVDARLAHARRRAARDAHEDNARGLDGLHGDQIKLALLDRLSIGVLLVDPDGQIAFSNDQARALSARTGAFSLDDRLRMASTNLTAQLRKIISSVAHAAARNDDIMRGMTVPCMTGAATELSLICVPVEPGTRQSGVAVFVSDPSHPVTCPSDALTCLFGLTPTEAQVTQALVGGRQRAEVARDLGISQTTVAFHLRNIFEKTGTNRQAELLGRVMRAFAAIG